MVSNKFLKEGSGPKYEILWNGDDSHTHIWPISNLRTTLHRIRALRDFGDVKRGQIGGFVENAFNLAQYGECWIYDDAFACRNSKISGNAKLFNKSTARGGCVTGGAQLFDDALIDDGIICDNAKLSQGAWYRGGRLSGDTTFIPWPWRHVVEGDFHDGVPAAGADWIGSVRWSPSSPLAPPSSWTATAKICVRGFKSTLGLL
jgi:hypothetical protein